MSGPAVSYCCCRMARLSVIVLASSLSHPQAATRYGCHCTAVSCMFCTAITHASPVSILVSPRRQLSVLHCGRFARCCAESPHDGAQQWTLAVDVVGHHSSCVWCWGPDLVRIEIVGIEAPSNVYGQQGAASTHLSFSLQVWGSFRHNSWALPMCTCSR